MRYDVGSLGDFPEAGVRVVDAGGEEIGVVRWRGELFAVRNVCPHQLGPVARGPLRQRLVADSVGDPRPDPDTPVLACPWHGWEFDVRTGRPLAGVARVRTYQVEVEDGRVVVAKR